jgi:hypothetical protein
MTTVTESINGTLNVAVKTNCPLLGTLSGDLSITPAGTNVIVTAGKIFKTDTINTTSGGNLSIATSGSGNILLSPAGQVQVAAGATLTVDIISTTSAATNLSLNPTGASINCNNKTLINVAGISGGGLNFLSGTVATANATPATIVAFPTVSNTGYILYIETSIITAATVGGNATAGASFTDTVRVYNSNGTVTLPGSDSSGRTTSTSNIDAALSGITVTYVISGTTINVTATGLGATNIGWSSTVWYTSVNTSSVILAPQVMGQLVRLKGGAKAESKRLR